MNKDIEEKDEKTKSFSKILEDKFHTLQTYKNIMITFHQQLDSESKKTDSKRFFLKFFNKKKKILILYIKPSKLT